jgi:hypothetical protein
MSVGGIVVSSRQLQAHEIKRVPAGRVLTPMASYAAWMDDVLLSLRHVGHSVTRSREVKFSRERVT